MIPRFTADARWTGVATLVACLAGSCARDTGGASLGEPRDAPASAAAMRLGTPTHERLGVRAMAPARQPGSGELTWTTPAGWTQIAPTAMRAANFRVGADGAAECYLTLLGGAGGGLEANLNRWRAQMGQAPLTAEQIAELPTAPLLGGDAVLVDFEGSFAGMGGGERIENARLVGLTLIDERGAAFLKMTGPSTIVGGQLEAFLALAASMRR